VAASRHGNTPDLRQTSHTRTGYPIHHFRGRELARYAYTGSVPFGCALPVLLPWLLPAGDGRPGHRAARAGAWLACGCE
jgi:hypothetical protein